MASGQEWRWSYDPRADKLDIWPVEDGEPTHYQRIGPEGYSYCAQGRLFVRSDGTAALEVHASRPSAASRPTKVRIDAETALNAWAAGERIRIVGGRVLA